MARSRSPLIIPRCFPRWQRWKPVLEPGFYDGQITARNRLHHGSGGPSRLIGPDRDPDLFAANTPANRAIRNAERIRERDLAIYIEAGDRDFINVHDGSSFCTACCGTWISRMNIG
jgi:hypothetical protein